VGSGVAWPCGTTWSPPIDVEVLRELLSLSEGDLAVFAADVVSGEATYELIPAADFVLASRSAARFSAGGWSDVP
jgi:hypothetical protein